MSNLLLHSRGNRYAWFTLGHAQENDVRLWNLIEQKGNLKTWKTCIMTECSVMIKQNDNYTL